MGFLTSMLGGTPSYLNDANRESAQFQTDMYNRARSGWDAAQNAAGLSASSDMSYNTAMGGFLGQNPYLDQQQQALSRGIQEGYAKSVVPQVLGGAAGSGRYGSGLFQKTLQDTQSNMNRDIGEATSNLYANDYARERRLMEQAANRLGQQYDPLARQKDYYSMLGAINPNVNTNLQQKGWLEAASGLMDLNMKGMDAAAQAAALAASDRRLKENIELIETLDGVNIYSFDYIDGAKDQVGVLAQEVQEDYPEAVKDGEFLSVYYDRLPKKVFNRIEELRRG